MLNKKIAIIGGGNLGTAIAEGLIQSGFVQPKHILITKRNIRTLNELERNGVLVSDKNEEAVRYADLVILAVKPYQVSDILQTLKDEFKADRHVLVSVVTGVSIDQIAEMAKSEVISGGMLPKLSACREALLNGVKRVRILPAEAAGSLPDLCSSRVTHGTEVMVA